METADKNSVSIILRWVLFLPCAAIASLLGWYIVNILGRFGLYFVQFDTKSFISQLYFNPAGHAAMAIAFVYIGSKIAPFHRKTVAYVLSGIWFLFSGFTLFTAILVKNGWAIWGSVWSFVVIVALAFFIYQNEIDI
nr:putative uncharacterized protein [uncultured bacterium]BAJ06843.1 putative uncharacterized protein [uncultured bacterium]